MFAFKQCYQTGHFIRTKSDEKCQNSRYQKVRLSDAVERKRSQICKLNLWMATTAVAFFCQTPKFAKNFFFFFCFLKLRQEGAKKSNFMLTTITSKLLLSRLKTRHKIETSEQETEVFFSGAKRKTWAERQFPELYLSFLFSVYFFLQGVQTCLE